MLSVVCLPEIKQDWDFPIIDVRKGLSRSTKSLVMILRGTEHRLIGRN